MDVSGEPGSVLLITIVSAKMKDKDHKQTKTRKKTAGKKRVTPWPLLQTPERGGGFLPLGFRGELPA